MFFFDSTMHGFAFFVSLCLCFWHRDDKEWSRFHKAMAPKLLRPRDVRENLKSLCNMSRDAIKYLVKIRGTGGLENEIPDLEEVLFKFAPESKF